MDESFFLVLVIDSDESKTSRELVIIRGENLDEDFSLGLVVSSDESELSSELVANDS